MVAEAEGTIDSRPGDVPRQSSLLRRLFLGAAALLALGVGALLCATLRVGSDVWPREESSVQRKLGTPAAEIERLLAAADARADVRIGLVGDIQNGVPELGALLDSFRGDRLDFLLQLGDAANTGEPARYAVLRKVFADEAPGIPIIAVPGNHDIEPDDTTRVWTERVGPAEWRLDVRGWRILGIDDAAGSISPASIALLRRAAVDAPPPHGTIVVAHRPLAARVAGDGTERRTHELAATGLHPTMTFAGHWHENDTYTDGAGAVHYLLGENCDRSSSGSDPSMSKAILVLSGTSSKHTLAVTRVERRRDAYGEFLRLAVGQVYPLFRERPVLGWGLVAASFVSAALLLRLALRRRTS